MLTGNDLGARGENTLGTSRTTAGTLDNHAIVLLHHNRGKRVKEGLRVSLLYLEVLGSGSPLTSLNKSLTGEGSTAVRVVKTGTCSPTRENSAVDNARARHMETPTRENSGIVETHTRAVRMETTPAKDCGIHW
jgi:hypothetical protein